MISGRSFLRLKSLSPRVFDDLQSICQYSQACACARSLLQVQTRRAFVTAVALSAKKANDEQTGIVPASYFEEEERRNRDTFLEAIGRFYERVTHRRGHVEFIYSALKHMDEFGVNKDLEAYKRIMDIFPKSKMIPVNVFQSMFQHYPKQQHCAVDILQKMEDNGVMPDKEMESIMMNVFGDDSFAVNKLRRMAYWMPKFRNLSPFPLPRPLPEDTLALAQLAIERITSVDLQTKIEIYQASELEDAVDNTWIVSGQSTVQEELVDRLKPETALYVEGGFRLWLRNTSVSYFILRAEATDRAIENLSGTSQPLYDPDDVGTIKSWILGDLDEVKQELEVIPTIHEQEDGTILGCCATGTSSRDSLLSWIRFLQKKNPKLGNFPVLFTLKSPLGEVIPIPGEGEKAEEMVLEKVLLDDIKEK